MRLLSLCGYGRFAVVVFLFLHTREIACGQGYVGAQQTLYNLHQVTVETGLSQNTVTCVLEDSEGMVWIGTENGLNLYDGYDLRVFKTEERDSTSISENSIRSIFQDSKGRIWVGTFNGLNLYDKQFGTFTRFFHEAENHNSLSQNSVLDIAEDQNGHLWLATYHGLSAYHHETKKFDRYYYSSDGVGLAADRIYTICIDQANRVWAGTEQGVSVIESDRKSIRNIPFDNRKSGSLRNFRLRDIFQDREGRMWFATEGDGVAWLNEKTGLFTHFRHAEGKKNGLGSNLVTCVVQHSNGDLWFGTDGAGIYTLDFARQTIVPLTLNNSQAFKTGAIYDIEFSESNRAWVGFFGKGLLLVNEIAKNFTHYQYFDSAMYKLGKNSVIAFAEDADRTIWIGTDGAGMYRFDPATQKFKRYVHDYRDPSSISTDVVKSLAIDHEGTLYAGTFAGGLNIMQKGSDKFRHYRPNPHDTTSIRVDHVWWLYPDVLRNSVWVGQLNGLDEFDKSTQTFRHYTDAIRNPTNGNVPSVFTIVEDRQKNLWLGLRDGGLIRLNAQRERVRYYLKGGAGIEGTIPADDILDILPDKKGNIWIGTASHGLWLFDPARETFVRPMNAKDLPDAILTIMEDRLGHLWISTYKGLYNYHPSNGKWYLFDVTDGLPTNEFNYGSKLKTVDGKIYLGGLNGFVTFQPESIQIDTTSVSVALTGLSLFHKEVKVGDPSGVLPRDINYMDELIVEPSQNVLTLRFAAIDHHFPKVNQYMYRLDGFDEDWNVVKDDSRAATYTNLSNGEYTFRVKASNHDGIWNENDRIIRIVVKPYWYATWWFRAFASLAVVGIMMSIIWARTKILTKQSQRLQALVNERTNEIRIQKDHIESINKELLDHNEELKVRNEEIQAQREHIQVANEKTKVAYEQLKELNAKLEQLVSERTSELNRTIQRLTETDEGLSMFLYRSSHDLRGPITSLLGLTSLARLENSDPESHAYCDMIDRTCYKMLRFLKRLGNVTSVFKIEIQREWVDLNQVMDVIKQELRASGVWSNAELVVENKVEAPLWTDKDLLRNILFELIDNSFTFVQPVRPEVRVHIRLLEREVMIKVEDNGAGISKELQDRVFELFFRGSENSMGNGLGLYLVRKSTELLGGRVEMNSRPGDGTTVCVYLPLTTTPQR